MGKAYRITDWITADDFTNVGGTNADGNEFVATGTTPTTWTNSSVVVRIGAIIQLEQDGIGINQWIDISGNELYGAVAGPISINRPANDIEKYTDLTVTANTTFILPKGYMITAIVVRETAGNDITGGIDVGYSAGSPEIVNAMAVGANAEVVCTLIATGVLGATFDDSSDVIHVAATTDWNSASIKLRVWMQRLTND